MQLRKIAIILTILISSVFWGFNCDEEGKDDIEFKVICDGTFEGWYIIDAGDITGFGAVPVNANNDNNGYSQTGDTYYFQKTFSDIDEIEINATRDTSTDELIIYVYRDNKLVKETRRAGSDTSTENSLNLRYEYGEESSSSGSTSTSTSTSTETK